MISIGIIDTGVNLLHPELIDKKIICKQIGSNGEISFLQDNSDQIGHGTAICGILAKNSDVEITVFKAFESSESINEKCFLDILDYIYLNEHFNIINLSLGISLVYQLGRLEQICKKITDKGTIMVAAYSNSGSVTYPAAFPFVIGVDWDIECKKNEDFIYCENGIVDVYAKGMNQKLCWSPYSNYIVNSGASFATAHMTSNIAKWFRTGKINYINDLKSFLKNHSMKKICLYQNEFQRKIPNLKGKKVSLFPFNKELISLTNYSDLLACEITHVYDVKEMGNVNKSTLLFSHRKNNSKGYVIQNFNEIEKDKETFDILVVGHLLEINRITNHNYTKECIDFCLEYGKEMISFDTIPDIISDQFSRRQLSCYNININKIFYDISEKLRIIGIPIITVIGTSSKQGKFSLQLELRREFIQNGYSVGQWATEPQGYLLGIDQIFPTGYGSNMNFSEKEVIHEINNQFYEIEKLGKNIIISGLQSFLICEKLYNTHMFPVLQSAILSATQPDVMILVVNVYDSDKYILRTIKFAESLTNSKVLCIVLSFRNFRSTFSPLETNDIELSEDEFFVHIKRISVLTGIDCFSINQVNEIFKCIIRYLNEGERV